MRVTRSAKAMDGVSGPAPGPESGVFDESLMATDVPQARDGGKGSECSVCFDKRFDMRAEGTVKTMHLVINSRNYLRTRGWIINVGFL